MNGNLKPSDRAAIVGVIDPDLNVAGTVTTAWVAMADWGSVLALVAAGTLGASATIDAKFEQAQDATGTGAKDIAGKAISQMAAGTDDDTQALIDLFANELDINNGFTHARLSLTVGTASSDSSAVLIGLDPRYGAASDGNADTVTEIV